MKIGMNLAEMISLYEQNAWHEMINGWLCFERESDS